MDQYFERIQQLLGRSDFPVRIRFMIEDVIDLRNAKVALNACTVTLNCITLTILGQSQLTEQQLHLTLIIHCPTPIHICSSN